MNSLPIPFVVVFMTSLLLASNHAELKKTATGRVFEWVLVTFIASTLLVGLRWSLGLIYLLPFAAVFSVAGTALLYLAYLSLGRVGPVLSLHRDWLHLIPSILIVVFTIINPFWLESLLIVIKLIYAWLLFKLAKQAPHSLQLVRLGWLKNSQYALWGAALLVVISALLDVAILLDFAFNEGRYAANYVGIINLLIVFALGWVSVSAGRGQVFESVTDTENKPIENSIDTNDDGFGDDASESLMKTLNHLLIDEGMYADTELNLHKIARKAGIPARQVSRTINRQTGQNMSQWVNQARINAVCELLRNDNTNVTEAMHKAGFLTKSNFNREFKRIKGVSPSQWRANESS